MLEIILPILVYVVPFLILLGLGFFVGGTTERRHYARIERREQEMSDMLLTQVKTFPHAISGERAPELICAEVVVATDYLKSLFAKFRNFFGGEVRSYQTLMDRARREALLRVQARARHRGHNALCNIRIQTADVGGNSLERKVATVAVIASATAYTADA